MADRFEPLYDAAEMRAAEERYPGYPDTVPELMERAGAAVAREAMLAYPAARRFACVCGGGSNGGDGRVAARVLREAGHVADETEDDLDSYDVIVDALFGTGFQGAPRAEAVDLIQRINAASPPVVSVDLPSGVDASTGEIAGAAVDADLTVTFHAPKVGLAVSPGRMRAGRVVVADIGLDHGPTRIRRATPALLEAVPRRRLGDTKYTAGAVLVVGGEPGMTSAACLTARAAFRADAGYVTLAVPADALPVAETLALEPVKVGWRDETALESLLELAERVGAIAIGPGLGRSESRRALVRELLLRSDLPTVVDADALYELAPFERMSPTVLTPHAGELARLLGVESSWVDAHRLAVAGQAAELFGAVVLLKGADTIVACARGRPGRLRPRASVARDRRHGRRPHRRARVVPGEGPRARAGRDVCGGCARAGRTTRPAPGRPRRERPPGHPPGRPRSLRTRLRENASVERSSFTLDLGAIRRNAATLAKAAGGAELWAVVKAEGYGHGAVDVSKAALEAGASALCVATLPEALHLRAALRNARIVVMGPVSEREMGEARVARLELVAAAEDSIPEGVRVHLKVDTGMGRWGLSELPSASRDVVGLMSHLASAESDPVFTHLQIERFKEATAGSGSLTRHVANSAATIRYAEARFDAVRCGIALYGISPFGGDPADDDLVPALRWESYLALVKQLDPGESTGYGRKFVADRPTWIGIVPVGYADGFRRDMTGTQVLVEG